MEKKQVKISLKNVLANDQWNKMMYAFFFDDFKKNFPDLNPMDNSSEEDYLVNKFHEKYILPNFGVDTENYGEEIANIDLVVDEDLNIVSGKIIKPKSK